MFQISNGFLDLINPLSYVSQAQYVNFWQIMFATLLHGFWARFVAATCLGFAMFVGIYKQRVGFGIFLFAVAVFFTYFGSVATFIFGVVP